jgi:hypothetical protein
VLCNQVCIRPVALFDFFPRLFNARSNASLHVPAHKAFTTASWGGIQVPDFVKLGANVLPTTIWQVKVVAFNKKSRRASGDNEGMLDRVTEAVVE